MHRLNSAGWIPAAAPVAASDTTGDASVTPGIWGLRYVLPLQRAAALGSAPHAVPGHILTAEQLAQSPSLVPHAAVRLPKVRQPLRVSGGVIGGTTAAPAPAEPWARWASSSARKATEALALTAACALSASLRAVAAEGGASLRLGLATTSPHVAAVVPEVAQLVVAAGEGPVSQEAPWVRKSALALVVEVQLRHRPLARSAAVRLGINLVLSGVAEWLLARMATPAAVLPGGGQQALVPPLHLLQIQLGLAEAEATGWGLAGLTSTALSRPALLAALLGTPMRSGWHVAVRSASVRIVAGLDVVAVPLGWDAWSTAPAAGAAPTWLRLTADGAAAVKREAVAARKQRAAWVAGARTTLMLMLAEAGVELPAAVAREGVTMTEVELRHVAVPSSSRQLSFVPRGLLQRAVADATDGQPQTELGIRLTMDMVTVTGGQLTLQEWLVLGGMVLERWSSASGTDAARVPPFRLSSAEAGGGMELQLAASRLLAIRLPSA